MLMAVEVIVKIVRTGVHITEDQKAVVGLFCAGNLRIFEVISGSEYLPSCWVQKEAFSSKSIHETPPPPGSVRPNARDSSDCSTSMW